MSSHPSTPAPDAAAEAEAKWLTEALLGRPDCNIFRQLEGLRRNIRAMGVIPRFRSPPPDPAVQRSNVMYQMLQSMDQGPDHPPGFARRTAWFLDIGSDSDGFARYILGRPNARGVGVIPPFDEGGTGWAIPPGDRFELHGLDLFDLVSRYLQSRVLPFNHRTFDFIILDSGRSSPRTLVAQLTLALHTICDGGQILLKLPCIEQPIIARILIALAKIADYITVSKPQAQAWGHRFYLHAQTVRHNSFYRKFKDNLNRLCSQIHGEPKWHELELIATWEEVLQKSNVDWIVKLGNPIWGTQLNALNRALGIDSDQTD